MQAGRVGCAWQCRAVWMKAGHGVGSKTGQGPNKYGGDRIGVMHGRRLHQPMDGMVAFLRMLSCTQ